MNRYDVIVIGGGSAGYVSAIRAAQLGKQVVLIERDQLGGTCLNRGCIPTKTLLHTAKIFHQQKDYALLGLNGKLSADPAIMNQRKEAVIGQLKQGIASLLSAYGITVVQGEARLVGEHLVQRGNDIFEANYILIATGSSAIKPPIPGIEHAYTSDDILDFQDKLFDDVVIIGGGVIGIEFASLYQELGKKVTVLEAQDRILGPFDKEIAQNLTMILKRRGTTLLTQAMVKAITKLSDGRYEVEYEAKGQTSTLATDAVIVAAGRKANGIPSDIALEYDHHRIKVNEHYQTSLPHIYAAGDVSSAIQLAHLASHQGVHAINHMYGQLTEHRASIPMCIYTSPEIATVGVTEAEAKAQGRSVLIGKYATLGNSKTIIENQDRGFVKVVVDENTRTLIGAQLMCDRASDMIAQLGQAIDAGLTIDQLQQVMYPHPSFSEAIHEALLDVTGQAIHVTPKKRI